jgi:hypothetical protein
LKVPQAHTDTEQPIDDQPVREHAAPNERAHNGDGYAQRV